MSRSFLLPGSLTADALAARLAQLGQVDVQPEVPLVRTFMDTFDWRLHREDLALDRSGAEGRLRLRLARLDGAVLRSVPAPRVPASAAGLPAGPLREQLAGIIEPRALLDIASVRVTSRRLVVRGPGGGTEARLLLERATVSRAGGGEAAVPPVLTVTSGRQAAAVTALLSGMADLGPGPDDLVAFILGPLGRRPRDYSGKVKAGLVPGMCAREAVVAILRALLGTMERNLPGVRDDVDPEFLHDLRVAVRRTRSALGQVKGILPAPTVGKFMREFRWVQEVTGPVRDLDVYLLGFPEIARLVAPAHRRSLAPLATHLRRRRAEAIAAMLRDLSSRRFERLLAEWRQALDRPAPARPTGCPNALAPSREVGAKRIRRLFRRAVREGRAIDGRSPASDLHELRKTCKKLRYLLEFFAPLLDREGTARLIDSLKVVQDDLGRIQDLQIQADALLGYAGELAAAGRVGPRAFLAMGMLVERLREEQRRARGEFDALFREFAAGRNRKELRRLLSRGEAEPPDAGVPDGEPGPAGEARADG